ncbi:MAG: phosphatidylserine decarboxylase family protein [Candidatus Hydrogenedentes bacterium]|nr:phosphatidylserine decarboxylase family protein [Candidatus Hydrogenedentota bacterium]
MNTPFSGWKEGLPYYGPLLAAGAILFLFVGWSTMGLAVSLFVLVCGLFTLFFFRDPVRAITRVSGEIVAPADGTIVGIEDLETTPHYDGPCTRISIFLSVLNVHINRAPFDGQIADIRYQPGRFLNAMKAETTDLNESNAVRMTTSRGLVTVRQISGAIARRIVCRRNVGDTLARGEKFGMIKFGSRTELYLPPGTEVCVKLRDKVRGGSSVVARFP